MDLPERCRRIDFLLLDVDGVLTDGRIVYTDAGTEVKAFHVRDGAAVRLWERAGKRSGILTGRRSSIVERRAAELGVKVLVQGADDKLAAFTRLLAENDLRPEQVAFMGDDLMDVPVLRRCGLAIAVADACGEAREAAHFVTAAAGGHGAVREAVEWLLRMQGHWNALVTAYVTV